MIAMRPSLRLAPAILAGLTGATAGTDSLPAVEKIAPLRYQSAIPYPNGALYLRRCIHGAFSGGRYRNYGEDQSLYQWQGEMGYFYTPWLSGGFGFKMNAGEPSDSTQKVKNRFFIIGRAHHSWKQAAGYFGAQIGLDDLNVSLTPLADSGNFREPLRETNAGLDLEFGLGWKFSRYVGATLGQRLELSLVGEEQNPESAVNFRGMPGLALDMLPLFPGLRETVKAFHVFSELQVGRLIRENVSRRQDFAWVIGASLAF
jgi:hypothetical protein